VSSSDPAHYGTIKIGCIFRYIGTLYHNDLIVVSLLRSVNEELGV